MYAMSRIWTNRIEAGNKTLDECPDKYAGEVLQLLKADLDEGKITEFKYYVEILGVPIPIPDQPEFQEEPEPEAPDREE